MKSREWIGDLWVHVDTDRIKRGEPPIVIRCGEKTVAFVQGAFIEGARIVWDPRSTGTEVSVWIEAKKVIEVP